MSKLLTSLFGLLQLFAYDPQVQPVNNTNSTDVSAEMKIYYDRFAIKETKPNLIHDQFAVKKPIPAGNGKSIEFRKLAPLAKADTPLVEGVTPEGKKLVVTTITATVEQYGDFIPYTDVLQLTTVDDLVVEGLELLSAQAGVTLDTVTRNVINAGSNVSYASVYDATTKTETKCYSRYTLTADNKLTVREIKKGVTKLKKANAPKIEGSYVGIIHPCISEDLQNDPEFIDAHKYAAPENLFAGEIGKIAGVRFVESSEAKIFSGANLASDSRTLTVNGAVNAAKSITFSGGTVEANALKGRFILVNGQRAKVVSNTTTTITVSENITCADKAVIYPGEGGAEGCSVFSCLLIGKGAYATTEIESGGLQTFVKQLGSGGTTDPINQRSTVGWKAGKVSEILIDNYMVRIECGSSYNDEEAN